MGKLFLSTVLLALTTSGCAVLGLGAGVVISQDMMDSNTFVAQLNEDVDVAWATTKASMGRQSDQPIHIFDDVRSTTANIDGAEVTASIEVYDLDSCRLIISARKYGVPNGDIAELVFGRVLQNFSE
ncbi:MAG: hypothetical protein ACI9F9_003105 [Candidatus Paceibacteria bacterium]|jgi:hypothetical protein